MVAAASAVVANDVVLNLGSCSLVVDCIGTWGGGAVVEGVVLVVVVMNMAVDEKMVAMGLGCARALITPQQMILINTYSAPVFLQNDKRSKE
ncbi:hypothetical protein Tco_0352758 [Tanacetum coccineum]